MANATVIKLTNNDGTTLLPISDSAYIQHKQGNWTTSTHDIISYTYGLAHPDHNDLQTLSYTSGTGIQLKDDATGTVSGTVQVEGSGLIKITGSNNKMVISTTATNNTGTVTSVAAGYGLVTATGNAITGSDTIKAKLKDYTKNSSDATTADKTDGSLEPVQLDKSGNLAVYVKDTHNSHTITWSGSNWTPNTTSGPNSVNVISYYNSATNTLNPNGTISYTTVTVPTIKYVDDQIGSAIHLKGTIGPSNADVTTLPTQNVKEGDAYLVKLDSGTNTTILSGQTLENGDLIIATSTTPTWTVIQNNLSIATSSKAGTVKPGTTSGKNYGVSVAADGAMTVSVPWTDNDHTSGVKGGNTTKGSNNVVSDVTIAQSTSDNHTTYTVTVSYSSITSNVTSRLTGENISGGGAYIKNFEDSTSNSKIWFKPGSNVSISYAGSSPNQYVQISATDTKYSAGTGIGFDGTTINHSNSVTAQTASKARYFKYDAQGHITGSGDISTQTVVKSATFANNMKYAELKTNAEDINETWLKTVTGLTNSISSSSYVAVSSHSTSTCTAYVKTT